MSREPSDWNSSSEIRRQFNDLREKIEQETQRLEGSIDHLRKKMDDGYFVRQDLWLMFLKNHEEWKKMQDDIHKENREWRARINLAIIVAILGFLGQAIFFVLTRR